MKSVALKQFFDVERETCNQMVNSVHHQYLNLEIDSFTTFIKNCLDPVMVYFDGESNQLSFPVAHAGFKHGLQLVALNWMSEESKRNIINTTWTEYYLKLLPLLGTAPNALFTKTANILHQLYSINQQFPLHWLKAMSVVAADCKNMLQLEQAGVVCAWTTGMAHYREAALKQLKVLPDTLYRKLFDLCNSVNITTHHNELVRNRWACGNPEKGASADTQRRHHRRVGQAEILGGDFTTTPIVINSDEKLIIKAGAAAWQLDADFYGSTLLPYDAKAIENTQHNNVETLNALPENDIDELTDIHHISSVAYFSDTIAITSPDTFAIILLSNPVTTDL